jgi:hypothetical protein
LKTNGPGPARPRKTTASPHNRTARGPTRSHYPGLENTLGRPRPTTARRLAPMYDQFLNRRPNVISRNLRTAAAHG